mmetsp:Transcript_12305/g.37013  ORF Transcript_12305/g.37013 Transcript_12305/m.37013 type:complete len:484 (-) Transcript_12305:840-2291(-)
MRGFWKSSMASDQPVLDLEASTSGNSFEVDGGGIYMNGGSDDGTQLAGRHAATREAAEYNNELDEKFSLPGTSKRTSGWSSVAVHNVTAIVGAGVLGLPHSMGYLTWPGGAFVLALSWVTSLYTLWQLCKMHEMDGLRFNRYHELGQYAFGPKLGMWLVVPFQIIVMTGLGVVYMITGGSSMLRVWQFYGPEDVSFGISAWILVFYGLQLFLSQVPNFNQLKIISLAAAITSVGYSTVAIGVTLKNGRVNNVAYNLDGHSVADGIFGAFNALGTIAFAYGGHNVVLEIQATMPSPPSTFKPYMRGVYLAYVIVSYCYFGVAFCGYWAYGNQVQPNILFSLENPRGVVSLAAIMVLIHVTGSYQVYSMPIYDMIETLLVRHGYSNGLLVRILYRSVYTSLTAFIAITLPFFIDIMGFIGALAFGPTTFALPAIIWLILKEPRKGSWHWCASYVCIVYGVVTTLFGSIGGLRSIIVSATNYKFYA